MSQWIVVVMLVKSAQVFTFALQSKFSTTSHQEHICEYWLDTYTHMNYNYGYFNHKTFTLHFLEVLDFIHNWHVLQSQ